MNKTDEKGFYIEGNKKGINKFTKAEYDKDGYNINGYNKFGYNKDGYDKDGLHKDTNTKYNLNLKDKNGNKLNSLFYIGDFVDEFNEKTNEQFVGYKGKIISSKYGKSSEKTMLMLITKDEIEFRLTPYIYLNSDGKVDCSIKIGEKIIRIKLWASKDSAYIFRKNNPKEYSKLIKEMENEGLMQIVIYNYDSSESFKAMIPLEGFKTLLSKLKSKK